MYCLLIGFCIGNWSDTRSIDWFMIVTDAGEEGSKGEQLQDVEGEKA